jgi:hypothetical protein
VKISAVDFLMCGGIAPKAPVRRKEIFVSFFDLLFSLLALKSASQFHLKRNSLSGGNEPGIFQI